MDSPEKTARVSQPRDMKLIVEKDVQVPMRDGTILYADIFRPDTTEKVLSSSIPASIRRTSCGCHLRISKRKRIPT